MTAHCVAICPPQPMDSLYERLYFTAKKLGSIYIHVFNEIRPYLYTRVQSRVQLLSILFIRLT
jgi:hypothetical protein